MKKLRYLLILLSASLVLSGCKGGKVKIKGHTGGKIKLPHVKAKGVYKGAVSMNSASREVMKQYQR